MLAKYVCTLAFAYHNSIVWENQMDSVEWDWNHRLNRLEGSICRSMLLDRAKGYHSMTSYCIK